MPETFAPLVWDQVGERLYETGVSKGVVYEKQADGTYTNGVAWNGLTGVNENPSGADSNKQWADNIEYLNLRGAEEFGATIEAFTYPAKFAEYDGSAVIATGVYIGQQTRKPFGFCYRTEIGNDVEFDDHGYEIHLVYNATVAPSSRDYSTINDSPEPITFSWELETTPVNVTGHKPTSHLIIKSTEADEQKLTALEAILYGSTTAAPRMPLPDEIITLMS